MHKNQCQLFYYSCLTINQFFKEKFGNKNRLYLDLLFKENSMSLEYFLDILIIFDQA